MIHYRIQEVLWADARTSLEAIRREVFVAEQGVPEEEEWDARDQDAMHFLALAENESQPIGTVRLLPEGKITRMAVAHNHRGQGIGEALLHKALARADQLGLKQVYLDAQVGALGFYRKYGFTAVGPVFLDAGIEHQRMTLELKKDLVSDNPVIRLDHPSEVLPLMRDFAARANRSIDIFSHQLNPALYDDSELVDAVSTLARKGPQTRVRILVRDPRPLYGSDRPLLRLTQRLPSHIHMRAYIEGASDPRLGFFCVDEQHLIHFADEPALTGFARREARAEARQLLDEFQHLWIYGSREDTNLRRLSL